MASLADRDSACLLILVEESEATGRPLTARQVATKFVERTTEAQAKMSLDHLVSVGFASSNFDNWRDSGYKVTRLGLMAAERAFDRKERGENTVWEATQAELSDLIASTNESLKTSDVSIQTAPQVIVHVENKIDARETPQGSTGMSWAGWTGVVATLLIGLVTIAIMKDWL